MRVITPSNLKDRRSRKNRRSLQFIFALFLVFLTALGAYYYKASSNYLDKTLRSDNSSAVVKKEKELRIFSDEELKNLYNNFNYANTYKIIDPPPITGNPGADAKIRTLAEARGYQLRRFAKSTEGLADNLPLQKIAEKSWIDLKNAAAKDGIVLTATWAFRTIEDQKMIFAEGLSAQGVLVEDIASGHADNLVDKVLQTYAPPGYSRHHTGFTVDLTCGTTGLTNFATTTCHEWLSRDNYTNAKTYGWIPSYPKGASLQGPEPEPWEYTWVTVDALLK